MRHHLRRPFSRFTIAGRITAIVLTLAVPLNLIIAAVIWHLSEAASETQRAGLLYTARSVAAAADAKLGAYMALAHALARSPALLEDNLNSFEAEARRAFAATVEAWAAVADLAGQQLINTAGQAGQALPVRNTIGLAAQKHAFQTRSAVISDVQHGTVSQSWVISIEVPIFKDGQPFRVLAVAVTAQSFFRLLNDQQIPKNWLAAVIDRQGRYIGRVPGGERYAGQLASEGWRRVKEQDGVSEFASLEGEPLVNANARSSMSGWAVGIAVKKAEMQAAVWDAIRRAMILGGGFSVLSLLFAGAIARSITGPIAELRQRAGALLTRPERSKPPGPPEIQELWQALKQSEAERDRSGRALRESEERLRLSNEAAGIGTFTVDTEAGCVYYSPELAAMAGVPGVRMAKIEDAFARIHRDDLHRVQARYEAGLSGVGAGQIKMDFRFVRPGGEVRWMTWAGRVDFREGPSGPVPFRIDGACLDITERKRHEDQIRLLMREVNHRSKNMLTLVQAIARQTLAAKHEDFLERFGARVEALAASQDLLVKNAWTGVQIEDLVRSQLAYFEDLIGRQIELQGPQLFVSAHAAQTIGMALHELATNPGKYGALASGDGRVEISWSTQRGKTGEAFIMTWRERCAHPVVAPAKRGFGSTVICEVTAKSLGATVDLDFPVTGLTWRLQCAAREVLDGIGFGESGERQEAHGLLTG